MSEIAGSEKYHQDYTIDISFTGPGKWKLDCTIFSQLILQPILSYKGITVMWWIALPSRRFIDLSGNLQLRQRAEHRDLVDPPPAVSSPDAPEALIWLRGFY